MTLEKALFQALNDKLSPKEFFTSVFSKMEKRAEVPTTPRVDDKFLGVTLSFELAKFHTHKVFFQK